MNDYIVRATAADGQVRAFAATTKELVEAAREHHNTSPVATAALGRLLTAGAMMGSMMKNDTDMLTLQVRGDGPLGGITVTADSKVGERNKSVSETIAEHRSPAIVGLISTSFSLYI